MTTKRPDIHALFNEAIEQTSDSDRLKFLEKACNGQPKIRGRVEALLQAYAEAGSFLGGTSPTAALTVDGPLTPQPGTQIGQYTLREQIGEGGMGIVYIAEQTEPVQRKVALKIIKPGMATTNVVARFEAERQALALMDHPNIAKVLDGGATDSGQPYFVMEPVQGLPVTEYCDEQRLSTEERLKLFVTMCKAVQHAHQKGVIHRDLKPSNVLVPEIDGAAVPKVIDFGVAKAIGQKLSTQTVYTQFSQLVGTPIYMSPEQAAIGVIDVDTRSDVYSLGVMLYELMTGGTPFDSDTLKKAGYDEMRRIIREDEPRRPSAKVSTLRADALSTISHQRKSDPRKLCESLRGELDWIVMKALQKDRTGRYASASDLREDVERYLSNQPIVARPPSIGYRLKKFSQRNKARLVPTIAAAAVLMVGLTFAAFAVVKERGEKLALLHDTARRLYVSQVRQGAAAWEKHDYGALNEFLETATPDEDSPDFRGWEWYFLHQQTQRPFAETPQDHVIQAAWRPKHNHIAVCVPRSNGVAIEFWKPESHTRLKELIVLPITRPNISRWSEDGTRLAIGTWQGRVTVVDAATGEVVFDRHPYQDDTNFDSMRAIDLSPNGNMLATASTFGNIRLWNVNENSLVDNSLEIPITGNSVDDELDKGISSVAFSPDGHHLAARMRFGRVITWNLKNDEPAKYDRTGNAMRVVEWHPNSKLFVSTDHYDVAVYERGKQEPIEKFRHLDANSISWIDENIFATGGMDHTIRLWDWTKNEEIRSLQIDRSPIEVCGASPDGRYLAAMTRAVYRMEIIRLDELMEHRYQTLTPPTTTDNRGWNYVHWSPDGRFIASGQNDARVHAGTYGSTVCIYDVRKNKSIVEYSISSNPKIDWSPDNESIQVVDSAGRIHTLGVDEPHVKHTRLLPKESDYHRLKTFNSFTHSAVNRQRGLIALDKKTQESENGAPKEIWIYDYEALEVVDRISMDGGRKSWSPDGIRLGIVDNFNVLIYDAQNQTSIQHVLEKPADAISWNSVSTELALGGRDGAIHILDAESFELRTLLGRHRAPVNGLDWSPDGARIASSADDGTLRIWDGRGGDELAVLHLPVRNNEIHKVDWSPDGRRLAVGVQSGEIYVLDAPSMPIAEDRPVGSEPNKDPMISSIRSGIASLHATDARIPIDDFDDSNDDGWTRLNSNSDRESSHTSHNASSGAYQLTTAGAVPEIGTDGSFLAALWDKSSDPIYSNGLIRAKVRVDSQGCLASIAFRVSGDERSGPNGYLFIASTSNFNQSGNFVFNRIKAGGTIESTVLGATNLTFGVGEKWWMEAGGIGDRLSMKVWRVGDPEPASPQLIVIDNTYSSGLIGVETNIHRGFPRPARINATFDEISFTPLRRAESRQ